MRTFLLCTNACGRTYLSVYRKIHRYLTANGLLATRVLDEADLVVVDTCAYCLAAEDDSLATIRTCLKHRKASAKVVVVGCLPTIHPESLAQVPNLEVLPPDQLDRLDELLGARAELRSIPERDGPELERDAGLEPARRAFHLGISTGCLGRCAYCAVREVWGRLKSKPIEAVVSQLEAGLAQERELFYLSAQDVGAYGVDIGLTIVDLLEALFAFDGDHRFILHDFNPQWLVRHVDALSRLFAEHGPKVAYLDVPVQSGSDRIVRRMRRPYRVEEVKGAIFALKRAAPDLIVELDVMMGFPGETEADFAKTKALVEALQAVDPSCVWLSGYSDRPRTPAAEMDGKVDAETIMRRFLELKKLVEEGPQRLGTGLCYYEGYRLF